LFQQQPDGRTAVSTLPPNHEAPGRIDRHLAMLQKLAECGMQLAERAAAEALQEPAADAPKRRRPDPNLLFIRLAAMVRACINQQARLAAGKIPAAPRKTAQTANDPRRHPISAFLHDAIEDSPKPKPARAEIHQAVEPLIDDYLALDPEKLRPGGEIAIEICKEFDIPYTVARMPDGLLIPPGREFGEYLASQTVGEEPPHGLPAKN
jgi:hypothetical protein